MTRCRVEENRIWSWSTWYCNLGGHIHTKAHTSTNTVNTPSQQVSRAAVPTNVSRVPCVVRDQLKKSRGDLTPPHRRSSESQRRTRGVVRGTPGEGGRGGSGAGHQRADPIPCHVQPHTSAWRNHHRRGWGARLTQHTSLRAGASSLNPSS